MARPAQAVGALDLVCDAVACYRLTRLVVDDTMGQPARDAAERAAAAVAGERGVEWAQELTGCYWCTGIWAAAAITGARALAPGCWRLASRALTMATVAGALGPRR